MALTAKQEAFAQAVAAGATQSDAYRQAYNVSPDTNPDTVCENASHLASNTNVAPRIQELKAALQKNIAERQVWTLDRIVTAAEEHRQLALQGGPKGVPAANGALELIGRATGLLTERTRDAPPVAITRVVVVLNRGGGRQPEIVDSSIRVLPEAESEDGASPEITESVEAVDGLGLT